MVCSATTMCAAATTGSADRCGAEPCPPRPVTVIVTESDEAMNEPSLKPNLPAGKPGMLCSAKMASQGKRSNRPSSTMRRPPPRPSSAGWKIRCTVPSKLRSCAMTRAAASRMLVWPSWPQACILPGTWLA
ncbi:hypothetical protein D9M69_675480 [compost metagenome]